MKDYEVIAEGFISEDGKQTKVGDIVRGNPRNGVTVCGLRFKQLKPAKAGAAEKAEKTEPAKAEPAKGPAAKKAQS
jgi:hypothetical protein